MQSTITTKNAQTTHSHNQNNNYVEHRGLGDLLVGINHIALTVSDVGRSTAFYTDVLGLRQVNRPNFYRHGAWLTAGTVDVHLIKGIPVVPKADNLVVPHLSFDVRNFDEVFGRLRRMNLPFELNVGVPKGKGKSEIDGSTREDTVEQAFLRDPDGHYIEICNCHVLADFTRGRCQAAPSPETRSEGANRVNHQNSTSAAPPPFVPFYCAAKLAALAQRAKARCKLYREQLLKRRNAPRVSSNAVSKIAKKDQRPGSGSSEAVVVNKDILANLTARREVYGDICQSFSGKELGEILLSANNSAPEAVRLMMAELYQGDRKQMVRPQAYYVIGVNGNHETEHHMYRPEPFEAAPSCCSKDATLTAGIRSLIVNANDNGNDKDKDKDNDNDTNHDRDNGDDDDDNEPTDENRDDMDKTEDYDDDEDYSYACDGDFTERSERDDSELDDSEHCDNYACASSIPMPFNWTQQVTKKVHQQQQPGWYGSQSGKERPLPTVHEHARTSAIKLHHRSRVISSHQRRPRIDKGLRSPGLFYEKGFGGERLHRELRGSGMAV